MTSALVGVNLIPVYYVLSLIVPYGFIILFAAGAVGFSSESDCQEKQPGRSQYLKLQFLAVALMIPTCFGHVIFFKIKGIEWIHKIYLKEDDDEDEEGEKEDWVTVAIDNSVVWYLPLQMIYQAFLQGLN